MNWKDLEQQSKVRIILFFLSGMGIILLAIFNFHIFEEPKSQCKQLNSKQEDLLQKKTDLDLKKTIILSNNKELSPELRAAIELNEANIKENEKNIKERCQNY